ncbi:hypothetical protein LGM58_20105 [Burkholderia contaminans]|uniref:hypothetical protein n=1 Tax=Burkholderia contaminans TaxID=488447 RepID=UPI001CF5CEE5|nr:hypothetical protein [Burkholderia contaminans]MCA7885489.1 hypothetical protein [Burkholderia contaminans]
MNDRMPAPADWPVWIAVVLFAVGGTSVFYDVPLLTVGLMLFGIVFAVAGAWPILAHKPMEWEDSWTGN